MDSIQEIADKIRFGGNHASDYALAEVGFAPSLPKPKKKKSTKKKKKHKRPKAPRLDDFRPPPIISTLPSRRRGRRRQSTRHRTLRSVVAHIIYS